MLPTPQCNNQVEEIDKKSEEKKEDSTKKKKVKVTGVGYSTGVGVIWDVNSYLKNKEEKHSQIIKLVDNLCVIAEACQDSDDLQAKAEEDVEITSIVQQHLLTDTEEIELREMILQSSLLPVLEAAFRSGSILEMAKELKLYMAYLSFTEIIAKKKNLFTLLLDIGPSYIPRQIASIHSLL